MQQTINGDYDMGYIAASEELASDLKVILDEKRTGEELATITKLRKRVFELEALAKTLSVVLDGHKLTDSQKKYVNGKKEELIPKNGYVIDAIRLADWRDFQVI